jgi:hypothetical protein
MNLSVLTQSNFDGMLLATLLAEEQERGEIEVRVASGLTSGYSVARTILAVKRIPVAVVIDADSPEPEVASERRRRAEEVLGDAAGGVPFRVIVAVPELEILFFERPDLLRRVFGELDEHVMELARLSPRRAIGKLAPGEPYESACFRILRATDADDVQALRETDLIRDLLSFIEIAVKDSGRPAVSKV